MFAVVSMPVHLLKYSCLYLDVCCCQHASTLAEVQYELDILGVKGPREEQNHINKSNQIFIKINFKGKLLIFFGGGHEMLNSFCYNY